MPTKMQNTTPSDSSIVSASRRGRTRMLMPSPKGTRRGLGVERQHGRLVASDEQEWGQISAESLKPGHVQWSRHDTLPGHR